MEVGKWVRRQKQLMGVLKEASSNGPEPGEREVRARSHRAWLWTRGKERERRGLDRAIAWVRVADNRGKGIVCERNHWSEKTDPKDVGWKQPLLLTKARITWKNLSQSLGPSVDSWILGPWDEACACVFWRKTNSPVWPRYLVKDQRHRMWFSNFYPKLLSWQQKTNTVITKNWRRTRYQPKRYNHKAVSAITKYMFPKSISANRSTGNRNQKPATPQDNPGGSMLTERP